MSTIDRQAAIEGLYSILFDDELRPTMVSAKQADEIIDIVRKLPSVQPLVLTCDGCRHVGTYDTDFPCSACIRREKDYYEQER